MPDITKDNWKNTRPSDCKDTGMGGAADKWKTTCIAVGKLAGSIQLSDASTKNKALLDAIKVARVELEKVKKHSKYSATKALLDDWEQQADTYAQELNGETQKRMAMEIEKVNILKEAKAKLIAAKVAKLKLHREDFIQDQDNLLADAGLKLKMVDDARSEAEEEVAKAKTAHERKGNGFAMTIVLSTRKARRKAEEAEAIATKAAEIYKIWEQGPYKSIREEGTLLASFKLETDEERTAGKQAIAGTLSGIDKKKQTYKNTVDKMSTAASLAKTCADGGESILQGEEKQIEVFTESARELREKLEKLSSSLDSSFLTSGMIPDQWPDKFKSAREKLERSLNKAKDATQELSLAPARLSKLKDLKSKVEVLVPGANEMAKKFDQTMPVGFQTHKDIKPEYDGIQTQLKKIADLTKEYWGENYVKYKDALKNHIAYLEELKATG